MKIYIREDTEKGDNDKDKQYEKNEDIIFSFFRELGKIEFWAFMAYVIILNIYFQSAMVTYL